MTEDAQSLIEELDATHPQWRDEADINLESSLRNRVIEWACDADPALMEESAPAWNYGDKAFAADFVKRALSARGEFVEWYAERVWLDVGGAILDELVSRDN